MLSISMARHFPQQDCLVIGKLILYSKYPRAMSDFLLLRAKKIDCNGYFPSRSTYTQLLQM